MCLANFSSTSTTQHSIIVSSPWVHDLDRRNLPEATKPWSSCSLEFVKSLDATHREPECHTHVRAILQSILLTKIPRRDCWCLAPGSRGEHCRSISSMWGSIWRVEVMISSQRIATTCHYPFYHHGSVEHGPLMAPWSLQDNGVLVM